jgi:hypothetical protein
MHITNASHFSNLPVDVPAATWRFARFQGAIISAGSLACGSGATQTALRCRRRPNRKPCPGRLTVNTDSEKIEWSCPKCGDSGTIYGWQSSEYDFTNPNFYISPCSETKYTVLISSADYDILRDLELLDRESERILLAARPTTRGIKLSCCEDHMDDLLGFIAFEANHTESRTRAARLDAVFAKIDKNF